MCSSGARTSCPVTLTGAWRCSSRSPIRQSKKALLSIILDTELRDNQQLRLMNGDGTIRAETARNGRVAG